MDQRRGGRPEHQHSLKQPSEAFKGHKKILNENSDSSGVLRDPRLSHDKYRAQIMKNKKRISPDTTQDKKNIAKEPTEKSNF